MGSGFGGYAEAMEMRDIIDQMVKLSLDSNRPAPTYARVYTIDPVERSCLVVMTGDVTPIKATCGSIMPSQVDQIVRLEGQAGARFVADVLGPSAVEAVAVGDVPWIQATLATGFTHAAGNPVRYRKIRQNGSDKVQIRGAASSTSTTAAAVTFWTMPVGYRPPVTTVIPIARNYNTGSNVALLNVYSSGAMGLDGKMTGVIDTSGQTGIGGGSARTETVGIDIGHSHKFLNTTASASGDQGWGTADNYRNADSFPKQWSTANTVSGTARSAHSHLGGAHQHPLTSVSAPTLVYLDGTEYFI